MEYKHGEPISELLADFFRKYTSEKDSVEVRQKYDNEKSLSLINQIRLGTYPVTEETEKYANSFWEIAVKNKSKEDRKFKPLLKKSLWPWLQ